MFLLFTGGLIALGSYISHQNAVVQSREISVGSETGRDERFSVVRNPSCDFNSKTEWTKADLEDCGSKPATVPKFVQDLDKDSSGTVSKEEILAACPAPPSTGGTGGTGGATGGTSGATSAATVPSTNGATNPTGGAVTSPAGKEAAVGGILADILSFFCCFNPCGQVVEDDADEEDAWARRAPINPNTVTTSNQCVAIVQAIASDLNKMATCLVAFGKVSNIRLGMEEIGDRFNADRCTSCFKNSMWAGYVLGGMNEQPTTFLDRTRLYTDDDDTTSFVAGTYTDVLNNAAGRDAVIVTRLIFENCQTTNPNCNDHFFTVYRHGTTCYLFQGSQDTYEMHTWNTAAAPLAGKMTNPGQEAAFRSKAQEWAAGRACAGVATAIEALLTNPSEQAYIGIFGYFLGRDFSAIRLRADHVASSYNTNCALRASAAHGCN